MKLTFSIIIPVYNVAPYLRECLDSVLAQAFAGWEAICVDDGSTDGSSAILDEYAKRDGRFKIIHQVNKGAAEARNAGLDVARGDCVWFVDGDDVIHPHALDVAYSVLADGYYDAFAFGDQIVGEGVPQEWPRVLSERQVRECRRDVAALRIFRMGCCYVLFRREVAGQLRMPRLLIEEDNCFFVSLFSRVSHIAVAKMPLYFYRQRNSSASHSVPSYEKLRDFFCAERNMLDAICCELVDKGSWNRDDLVEYVSSLDDWFLYGYHGNFLKADVAIKGRLRKEWIWIQKQVIELCGGRPLLRALLFLNCLLPFGWFVDFSLKILWRVRKRGMCQIMCDVWARGVNWIAKCWESAKVHS